MGTIDVFVYGTLKPEGIYYQQYCAAYLKQSQPAQVQGRLYNLPHLGYPTMTMGDGWVKGYLFTLDATAMARLDYLEGYNPDEHQNRSIDDDVEEDYTRQRAMVFNLAGQPIGEAWIYIMDKPPLGAVWVASGEWEACAK
ncbi:hypothetical protein Lepto7375DRAFT_7633 [Leptolyngbya sp. PCC 7375]|nr:hypothetical protein Lepto7375DRAFT_7633 [Leptolyngbya sp. PCC 7375]